MWPGRRFYLQQDGVLVCCSTNVAEIYAGIRPKEEERTEALLEGLKMLPDPVPIAQLAGLLQRDYSIADCIIAAVALHHEIGLITEHVADFLCLI
jgi:predicted nucleic acid-binding protein